MWPEQTKLAMPVTCSKSRLITYEQGLNDSYIVLHLNVPQELIAIILSYVDENQVGRLHIMNSTHYVQININYLIDEYFNSVFK